jgi:hypothetical protein
MPHLKITNGQPEKYSIGQLRRDNPNTSFPKVPDEALLADWGVYPLIVLAKPEYDSMIQVCIKSDITQVAGVWTQGWSLENKPQEDAESAIRNARNTLIRETDWMALSDVTMSQSWIAYRQALRDIPDQEGFPYSVTWPTKPE